MAEGLSVATANGLLSAIFRGVAYAVADLWAQKHVGPPGADGDANIAGDTRRVDASTAYGTSPAGGQISNDAAIGPWLDVPVAETYTHLSFWTAESGGTFVASGTVTAAAVAVGDDWSAQPGDCTAAFPTAS